MVNDLTGLGKGFEIINLPTFNFNGHEYNNTDVKIIFFLAETSYSIGELNKKLGIAPINAWKRITLLENLRIINIPKVSRGKKKCLTLTKQGQEIYKTFVKPFSEIINNIKGL